MTAHLVEEPSRVVAQCQLPRQEHCEGGFLVNGRNTPSPDTDELGVMLRGSQIEIGGTGGLEE